MRNKDICLFLSGKTGSGKQLIADHIVNTYDFYEYSFGKPIRDFFFLALPDFDYHENVTARSIINEIAEAPKRLDPACWAKVLVESIVRGNKQRVIVSDLRFNIEQNYCDSMLSRFYDLKYINVISNLDWHVNIDRSTIEKYNTEISEHYSNTEHESFIFDYILQNDGGLDDLTASIDVLMEDILGIDSKDYP